MKWYLFDTVVFSSSKQHINSCINTVELQLCKTICLWKHCTVYMFWICMIITTMKYRYMQNLLNQATVTHYGYRTHRSNFPTNTFRKKISIHKNGCKLFRHVLLRSLQNKPLQTHFVTKDFLWIANCVTMTLSQLTWLPNVSNKYIQLMIFT